MPSSSSRILRPTRSMYLGLMPYAPKPSAKDSSTAERPKKRVFMIWRRRVSHAEVSIISDMLCSSSPLAFMNTTSAFSTACMRLSMASDSTPSIIMSSNRLYRYFGRPLSAERRAARQSPMSYTRRCGALTTICCTTSGPSCAAAVGFVLRAIVNSVGIVWGLIRKYTHPRPHGRHPPPLPEGWVWSPTSAPSAAMQWPVHSGPAAARGRCPHCTG